MGNRKTAEGVACQNRNVPLIPDQCSAFSDKGVKLKHVCILYLLPNTISNLQPLDQGTICFIKRILKMPCAHFCYEKLTSVLAAGIRRWNIVDALCSVDELWESIMCVIIQNCFAKCGFGTPCEVSSEEDEDSKWVEFQVTWIVPAILICFSMLTNSSQPLMIRR
jgi:hypothetical protein